MSETDKITLPILELDLQKTTTYVARPFRLTQGDKGYWQAFHLSVGFQPYTITADKLCFAGTKPDGQLIDITNEPSRFELRDGVWYFKLPDELAQAVGTFTGYFYVVRGGTTVASTTKFAYEILAKFGEDEVSNSYVSIFNDLRDKFSQIVESSRMELNNWTSLNNKARADLDQLLKDLKTQTDNWLKAKTSEIEALIAKYNSKYNELVSQWNNQITTQQSRWQSQLNQQQSDFNSQKARIDSEYRQQLENLKSQLNSEWQQQKQAQQASFDSFKADLTNRISQAKSDIDSIQTKTTELQAKLDEINNKVRDVDFNSFIKVVNGNANDDLARFRNMCQLRIYDGNGQNVKSVPFQNNWFSVLVNMHSNWGTLTYLGQDKSIWQSSCNGDQWTSWTRLASMDNLNQKVNLNESIAYSGWLQSDKTYKDMLGDTWGYTDNGHLRVFSTDGVIKDWTNLLGSYSTGLIFGTGDVRATMSVSQFRPQVRFSGGTTASGKTSPTWHEDIAWKSDFANYYNKSEVDRKVNISDSLSRGLIDQGTSWQQIFGNDALNTNTGHLTVFKNSSNDYRPYIYGYSASGIAFGAGDTRGILSVRWDKPGIMIAGGNGTGPKWARELAIKDDFANYYNKSETDTKTNNLQGQLDSYKAQVSSLQTQLSTLQSQMSNLLSVINVSDGSLNVSGNLIVKHGNIQNYWGGVDQYVAYSPSGVKRGYFGVWDNGTFQARGN